MRRFQCRLFLLFAAAYAIGLWFDPPAWHSRDLLHHAYVITGLSCWILMVECLAMAAWPKSAMRLTGASQKTLAAAHAQLGWWIVALFLLHDAAPLLIRNLPWIPQVAKMSHHVINGPWKALWIRFHPIAAQLGLLAGLVMLWCIWQDFRFSLGNLSRAKWLRRYVGHRLWAVVVLLLAPHSIRLLRETELMMPLGWLTVLVTLLGVWAALRILCGRGGFSLEE